MTVHQVLSFMENNIFIEIVTAMCPDNAIHYMVLGFEPFIPLK